MEDTKNTNTYTIAEIEEMEKFLNFYLSVDEHAIETADEETRAKYKEYVEALCSIDNVVGLRTKAYACYGSGNAVYDTDWKTSEECLLKLVDLDNDYWACNTLGYIYYYGRTTDGVPDYDKAFKYFSVAALYGIYEAIYKIADLCIKGKGVPVKCLKGAENIINWLYDEVKPGFLSGEFSGQFADVASRMGRIRLMQAIENDEYTDLAYKFFLEASCALKKRMPYNHYGDSSVMAGVCDGLEKAKEKVSFKVFPDDIKERIALENLLDLVSCTDSFQVKIKRKGKDAVIHISKIGIEGNESLFVILPTIGYCDFHQEIKIIVSDVLRLNKKYVGKAFYANAIGIRNGRLVITDNLDGVCCKIKARDFRFKRKKASLDNKKYTIVSVAFSEAGKTYDYIYDLDTAVSEGEKVVVSGYNGESVVTVKKVCLATEEELKLPLEKYSKVIRKETLS